MSRMLLARQESLQGNASDEENRIMDTTKKKRYSDAMASRKGQEKILIDMAAILLFILLAAVFWAIFKGINPSQGQGVSENHALLSAHRALLEFMKSDYRGQSVPAVFAQADKESVEAMMNDYFTPQFAQAWECEITYTDNRLAPFTRGPGESPSGFSLLPQNILVYQSAKKVIAQQLIPLPDGETATITLRTWWLA